MARPTPALRLLIFRRYTYTYTSSSSSCSPPLPPHLRLPPSSSHSSPQLNLPFFPAKSHFRSPLCAFFLSHPHFPLSRSFSSQPPETPNEDESLIAQSLSAELLKFAEFESLSLPQRLDLSFSHITVTPSLILQTLNISPDARRTAFDFLKWVSSRTPRFELTDEVYCFFVDYFGRKKDFKVIHDVLVDGKGVIGPKCFAACIDRMVRAGRPKDAVSFFDRMEKDYGLVRDRKSLNLIVSELCEKGFASQAEKMVKNLANEFFPDGYVCDLLIKGWCVNGKLDEARRSAREMYRGGFEIGTTAYNAILDCVCKLCREKDPLRLQSEAEKVLVDMDAAGVPRNVETFNVLISNLCKIRKTEDAMKVFFRMGEWGCYPDAATFLDLTRSLYQAARIGEGDEMIDRMKSAGYGDALDKKAYYGFIKILCGIERIDHALSVFTKMKEDGCKPGIKTYDLLMGKLCAHGRVDKANSLFNEAVKNGVQVEPKEYKLDPRFNKKPTAVKKKGKKRLTLPEKMALKRKKLRKLNLSFVKKPKRMIRRMF
ncbi:Pentatricopeptide repeat-containing protein pnm1, mitochondrial [Dionaea muscipula]